MILLRYIFTWQSFDLFTWIYFSYLDKRKYFLQSAFDQTFICGHCVWLKINTLKLVHQGNWNIKPFFQCILHIYHVQLSKCKIVVLQFNANALHRCFEIQTASADIWGYSGLKIPSGPDFLLMLCSKHHLFFFSQKDYVCAFKHWTQWSIILLWFCLSLCPTDGFVWISEYSHISVCKTMGD